MYEFKFKVVSCFILGLILSGCSQRNRVTKEDPVGIYPFEVTFLDYTGKTILVLHSDKDIDFTGINREVTENGRYIVKLDSGECVEPYSRSGYYITGWIIKKKR